MLAWNSLCSCLASHTGLCHLTEISVTFWIEPGPVAEATSIASHLGPWMTICIQSLSCLFMAQCYDYRKKKKKKEDTPIVRYFPSCLAAISQPSTRCIRPSWRVRSPASNVIIINHEQFSSQSSDPNRPHWLWKAGPVSLSQGIMCGSAKMQDRIGKL